MKGDNKEINVGRSEEFTLVGQENSVPSPLQHSLQMPVLLSPCGCFPFCCSPVFSASKAASPEGYLASAI